MGLYSIEIVRVARNEYLMDVCVRKGPFMLFVTITGDASFLLSGVKCLILSQLHTCYSLRMNCTHRLRTDSRNSLLAGSAYSLTAPSLILKPSFQSFRVTSV